MSHIAGRVGVQCEVLAFNNKVRRENQIFIRPGSKHRAVVANALREASPFERLLRKASNRTNEIRFAHEFPLLRGARQHQPLGQGLAVGSARCSQRVCFAAQPTKQAFPIRACLTGAAN